MKKIKWNQKNIDKNYNKYFGKWMKQTMIG